MAEDEGERVSRRILRVRLSSLSSATINYFPVAQVLTFLLEPRENLFLLLIGLRADKVRPNEQQRIEVLKLFLASADFEDPDDFCWRLLRMLINHHDGAARRSKFERKNDPILNFYMQTVRYMEPRFKLPSANHSIANLLEYARAAGYIAKSMSFLKFSTLR